MSSFTEELRQFIARQLVEGVNRENGGLALGLAFNAIRDADWEELVAMVRTVLTEWVKRKLEFAGTDERMIPGIETMELHPDEPFIDGREKNLLVRGLSVDQRAGRRSRCLPRYAVARASSHRSFKSRLHWQRPRYHLPAR